MLFRSNGVATAPILNLSTNSLIVSSAVGSTSSVTLMNDGTAPVTITGLNFATAAFSAHANIALCTGWPVIPAGGNCRVDVTVAGGGAAGQTDTLTVTATPNSLSKTLSVTAAADAGPTVVSNNLGAGGCSIGNPNASGFDPLLLVLAALALGVLWLRRRPS